MGGPKLVSVRMDGSSPNEEAPGEAVPLSGARRLLAAGAIVVTLGLALVGSAHPDVGGPVLLGGWLTLATGIHRFGRET